MDKKLADRLCEYRRKSGLSQDELAEKVGVSRQAVSNWERGEKSPDTDNLIKLASVYNVTIDEMLLGDGEVRINQEETKTEEDTDNLFGKYVEFDKDKIYILKNGEKEKTGYGEIYVEEKNGKTVYLGTGTLHIKGESVFADIKNPANKEKVIIGNGGIYVEDGEDKVRIDPSGIHVEEKNGDTVHIGLGGININGDKLSTIITGSNKCTYTSIYAIIAFAAFFIFGFLGYWPVSWLFFFTIPIYTTLVLAIQKRNPFIFAYPVFITTTYLFCGIQFGLWHPYWIAFLTIPLYYMIASAIQSKKRAY